MMTCHDDARRTIIDLPDDQLAALDGVCHREGISRAEAVRQAVSLLMRQRAAGRAGIAFGIWGKRRIDGMLAGARGDEGEEVIELFLRDFRVVDLTRQVARLAADIRRRRRIRLPDAVVWASARVEGAVLVTRNTKDFPTDDPGLRVPYVS
jgi:predicted nucleic acid-binding protein